MPMMKNVLGLDLGSHTLKAVELRQTLRGLEPVQLRVHPRSDTEAPLAESLQRFLRMHQISTEHVTCALPGDRVSSRQLEFPFRDRKKLGQAVPFEIEGQMPFHLEDVVVDWQIVGGERSHAVVAAIIAQRKDVSEMLATLAQAGCDPRILEAEGLALGNLSALFPLPGRRLLVDMGHRKTTFCLLIDGLGVAARSVPVGGLALTRALARRRGIGLAEAEQQKCEDGIFQAGWSGAAPEVVESLDRIAREIVRSLESFETHLGGPASSLLTEVTLLGGAARLHRVDEYLAERTGLATQRLALPDSPESAALVAGGDPLLFAPAIALALRSTARATTHMNFRQDEFAYRADFRRFFGREMRPTAILAGIALLLLGTSSATSIALESRRALQLESQARRIYAEIFPGQPVPDRPVTALGEAVAAARARADFLGLYGGNLSALDLMGELSARVPPDLKVKFEEVNIDRQVIRVKVASENYEAADRLENELKKAPPFGGASVSGQIKKTKETITFSINIPLAEGGEDA